MPKKELGPVTQYLREYLIERLDAFLEDTGDTVEDFGKVIMEAAQQSGGPREGPVKKKE